MADVLRQEAYAVVITLWCRETSIVCMSVTILSRCIQEIASLNGRDVHRPVKLLQVDIWRYDPVGVMITSASSIQIGAQVQAPRYTHEDSPRRTRGIEVLIEYSFIQVLF